MVTRRRRSAPLFGCARCIAGLDRGHIDRDRHREHRCHRRTSLLRHFLPFTLAPLLLPSGVPPCSTARALIPGAGASVRGAAGYCRALAGAKKIAVIARSANAHRHAAAPAAIQPVALLPLLHRTPPQHWTAPGCARLNDVRKIAPTGIAPLEAREFLTGFPGLLCLGVASSLSASVLCGWLSKSGQQTTDAGASAADRGRLRFDHVVDDVNKPRMNPIGLPGPGGQTAPFPGITRIHIPVHKGRRSVQNGRKGACPMIEKCRPNSPANVASVVRLYGVTKLPITDPLGAN